MLTMFKSKLGRMEKKQGFSFGRNWQEFLKKFKKGKVKSAETSIKKFLKIKNLQGKTFLDIGCGSGLFSYAAFKLGAKRIVSFDLDPLCVKCCEYLHSKVKNPKNWKIYKGSVLDKKFILNLGKFDIVYSWGVLHHTGNMWEAIKNSAKCVNKNGYYYITIYNKVRGILGSKFWLKIKKLYNASPKIGKSLLEMSYISAMILNQLRKLRNPLKRMKNKDRGMDWKIDIVDWLGGYPYEFATKEEIIRFVKEKFPKFKLINIKPVKSLSCNWFLFRNLKK